MHCAFVVLSITRLGHHHIVDSLLRTIRTGWIITHVISFVPRKFFLFNVSTVQLEISVELVSLVNIRSGPIWNSVFHKSKFCIDIRFWFLITTDINVSDGVLGSESCEWSKWVCS